MLKYQLLRINFASHIARKFFYKNPFHWDIGFAKVLNTFFNWVLIYGHLVAPRLEVIGAGYATVIARFAEMLMFLLFIMYRRQPFLTGLSHFWHIDFRLFVRIIPMMKALSEAL